jgi:hypothetical protein
MRWGRVITALAATAAVLPASAAMAATTFEGSCSFSGQFTFDPPLGNLPRETRFSDAATGTCTGTLNGEPQNRAPIVIRAEGYGSLGCLAGRGTNAGTLSFTLGTKRRSDDVSLGFSTATAGALTQFVASVEGAISGEGVAHVNFLPYADQAALEACEAGDLAMARYDVVVQTITPFVG